MKSCSSKLEQHSQHAKALYPNVYDDLREASRSFLSVDRASGCLPQESSNRRGHSVYWHLCSTLQASQFYTSRCRRLQGDHPVCVQLAHIRDVLHGLSCP